MIEEKTELPNALPDNACVIRAGDIVHHEPTGEDWVVAYVDGENLAWCGWPAGEAKLSDCWLKKTVSDEEHRKRLIEIAKSDGKRGLRARQALAALPAEKSQTDSRSLGVPVRG